ncbi:serine/threonine-protein kinase [Smaragdicoccus niigatensis]|uniref:serine/threonine-protein kinase n=2 Tax=Smaragdicoccus niigatensis TaxID=359359 RepID=UPI0003A046B4|nr:serine/threonine-protein kinase [Smaragdicoccus niigatensis]
MSPESSATQFGRSARATAASRSMAGRDPESDIVAELQRAGLESPTEIGRGGFGTVYRCFQPSLDRDVAVKVLAADLDDENRERFIREEHAMGRLSGHPNIVDILQVGSTSDGRPYILMPFHARGSLDRAVRRNGSVTWQDAVRIGIKLAGAIESAHWMGILHRDVKPANVLLTAYDEPQLTDFGIARVVGGFETTSGAIVGSPAYIAPEVLAGEPPTERSDVYSLGATLFTLVTGHAAYERHAGEGVVAHFLRITEQPVPDLRRLAVPADVSAAIEAAMTSDPAGRPRSAAEFGQLLQQVELDHGLPAEKMALPADVHEKASVRSPISRSIPVTDETAPQEHVRTSREIHVQRAGELPRTRLLDVLGSARQKVVAIVAPAGYGKSTLAAQWRDTLRADGEAAAWVHIGTGRSFEADLAKAVLADPGSAGVELVREIVEHLGRRRTPLTLFIDGYDRILDDTTRDSVQLLLDADCPALDLVITSRTPLPATTGGRLEIDADALRFDAAETAELFVKTYGLPLSDTETDELTEATRGWATTLRLAAVALRGGTDAAGDTATLLVPGAVERAVKAIRRVRGGQEAAAGFLIDNLLNSMEPKMAEFLLSISAADPETLTHLPDNPTSRALLASAERRSLFVHRIEPDNVSELIPPAIADLLRNRRAATVKKKP